MPQKNLHKFNMTLFEKNQQKSFHEFLILCQQFHKKIRPFQSFLNTVRQAHWRRRFNFLSIHWILIKNDFFNIFDIFRPKSVIVLGVIRTLWTQTKIGYLPHCVKEKNCQIRSKIWHFLHDIFILFLICHLINIYLVRCQTHF